MATMLDSLVAYWPLDEASGNAIDAHGSNDLTETSGTIGSASGGRDFEAGDTELFLGPHISHGGESWTIFGWVNLESKPGNAMRIASQWSLSTNNREFGLNWFHTTDRFQVQVSTDGTSGGIVSLVDSFLGAPSTATNYFVCAWYDHLLKTLNIQTNAGKIASSIHTTGVHAGDAPFAIGAQGDYIPTDYFDGIIKGVGFYRRVLSSLERTWLYNGGSGPRTYSELSSTSPSSATKYVRGGGGWNWCTAPILASYGDKLAIGSYPGNIQRAIVTELDTVSGRVFQQTVGTALGEIDDHDQPCMLHLASGKILAVWAAHNGDMFAATSVSANDATSFGSVVTVDAGTVAYAQMVQVDYNDTIYLFHRGGIPEDAPQYLRTSSDDGATWSSALLWLDGNGERPYPQFAPHAGGYRIDFVTTDGHPRLIDTKLYSGYIAIDETTGARTYYKTDGTLVGDDTDAPFLPTDFTLVYDDANDVWAYDCEWIDGELCCLFARYPADDHDPHEYMRGKWNGSSWTTEKICDSGTTGAVDYLYTGEGDTYSGGLCFHPLDADIVYCAREYGSNIFRIQKWERISSTWTNIADISDGITSKCARPEARMVNGTPWIAWWAGRYTTYIDYDLDIYCAPDSSSTSYPVNTTPPSIAGTAQVGETLTCTAGSWDNDTSLAYQWYESTTEVNYGGTPISGATSSTLSLGSSLPRQYVYCVETATSGAGTKGRASNVLGPVAGPAGYDTVTPDSPASTVTDWFYVLNMALLSSDFWDAVKSDGGDVRAYDQSATRLAVHLYNFDYENKTGQLFVGFPTKTTSVESITIEAGYPDRSQPAAGDSYGQHAVFSSNWRLFSPDGGDRELTSYANHLLMVAAGTVGAAGPINGGRSTAYSSSRGESAVSVPTAAPLSIIGSANPTAVTAQYGLLGVFETNGASDNLLGLQLRGDVASDPVRARSTNGATLAASDTTAFSAGTYQNFGAVFASSTSRTAYINGTAATTNTTSVTPTGLDTFIAGAYSTGAGTRTNQLAGSAAYVGAATVALSSDWMAYWHSMLNPSDADQSDFWTSGGWTPLVEGPPTNSVAPAVTGTEATGKTLSCTTGTWSGADSYAYQWYSNSAASTSGGTAISGATSSTYVVADSLDGLYIYCIVTATNEEGSTAEPSNVVGPILGLTVVVKANPTFADVADFQDLRLINEAVGDAGAGEEMPAPSTWETDSPVGDVDWSAFTLAVDAAAINRSNRAGATLISPNYVVLAAHAPGDNTGHTWMTPAGAEVTRTLGSTPDVDYWELGSGDLAIAKLSAPINNITPMPMILDCSKVAGRDALCIEMDRHLNVFTIPETLDNTDEDCTVSHSRASDGLESGDSGKPCVIIIDDTPVMVITAMYTASPGGPPFTGTGPNAAHFVDEIFAITAEDGESPTVWDLQIASGGRASGIANSFASAFSSTGFPFYF